MDNGLHAGFTLAVACPQDSRGSKETQNARRKVKNMAILVDNDFDIRSLSGEKFMRRFVGEHLAAYRTRVAAKYHVSAGDVIIRSEDGELNDTWQGSRCSVLISVQRMIRGRNYKGIKIEGEEFSIPAKVHSDGTLEHFRCSLCEFLGISNVWNLQCEDI